ncbi:MAG: 6-pyruvoyl tetrahydropterin synthase family protein [Candidatus Thermoplasmatota archaeon]|jgi:6-pyruvoyltetrahydropterin/6-carboxytetrahydropterin synthase|nr:6-pyruvoyl tetrahydropterin synthase family protein [Candidatus Thermoplasmatota archaeon]MDP7264412.1 6-pyruvoyl tetrahydropterin synthase family protein [Candidatus Thermoplasmatota archaeon]
MIIKLDGWKEDLRFSACHFIPHHEKCGRLHGHSYAVHLEMKGELNEEDVVVDFSLVKCHLREILNRLDHRIIIPATNRDVDMTIGDVSVELIWSRKRYVFPSEDVIILQISSSSAEMLAAYLATELANRMKEFVNLDSLKLGVDEGPGQGAWYSLELKE